MESLDYDEDEFRLKRDILDQQIIDTDAHRVVRVNDLKIVAVGDDLYMVAADIGFRGLLRRIGFESLALACAQFFRRPFQNVLVPSKYIDPFPARVRHDITLTVAQERLKKMHPADLADILEDLDNFERLEVLQTLPSEMVASTIAELEPLVRQKLLGRLKDEAVTKLLERLAPDAAKDIVSELPKRRMQHILTIMKADEAEEIRELLKFKEDTAGSLMNTKFMALPDSLTAEHALQELRKKEHEAEQIHYIYIVDDKGALLGVMSLRELIFVDPTRQLASLIKRRPVFVKIKDHVNDVIKKLTKYNLVAIPVVGKSQKLVGVITVDDILPLLQAELQ